MQFSQVRWLLAFLVLAGGVPLAAAPDTATLAAVDAALEQPLGTSQVPELALTVDRDAKVILAPMPPGASDHQRAIERRDKPAQADAMSVISRCAEAMGGAARLEAMRTLRVEYTSSDGGPDTIFEIRRPNLLRKEVRGKLVAVSDGTRASVQKLAPTAQTAVLEPAGKLQDFEVDIAKFVPAFFDHRAEYLGLRESGGAWCHVLEVVLPLGPRVTYLIDASTYLVRRVSAELMVDGKPFHPADWTWSDYRPVQGILYPSTFVVTAADGSVSQRKVVAIEINPPLDASRFRIPADARDAR